MRSSASLPMGLFGWVKTNNARSASYFLAFALAAQLIAATILFVPLAIFDEAYSPLYGPLGYVIRYVPIIFLGTLALFALQLSWYMGTVQKMAGFNFVDGQDEPRLCSILERLLTLTGLHAPYVAVIETPALNAFACGVSKRKSVVVVTRGLLDELTPAELESVLAHELAHIRNGDARLMAAANICLGNLRRLHKWNPLHFRNAIHGILCIGFPVLFPLMLIGGFVGQLAIRGAYGSRLVISGAREYIADAEAARLTKNPAALASALFKVQGRHQISKSHSENDAMMIAGDSEGPRASHPDVEERVDALARTTGSMVFNAPAAHQKSKVRRFARQAAGGGKENSRWAPFKKVGAVTGENMLGFTPVGGFTFICALVLSIVWQGPDVLNPSAVAEKMDIRSFGEVVGSNELKCIGEGQELTCRDGRKLKVSDFIDRRGTFLGFIAQMSANAKAEEEKIISALKKAHNVRLRPYTGDSGLLTGFELMTGDDGKFLGDKRSTTRLLTFAPKSAVKPEVEQVGCFHEHLSHGRNSIAEFSLTDTTQGVDFSEYPREIGQKARLALSNGDKHLLEYAAARRSISRIAFDLFGQEGLARMQGVYNSEVHKDVLEKLAERLQDPSFGSDKSELERIELINLSKRPEVYVPCLALRR